MICKISKVSFKTSITYIVIDVFLFLCYHEPYMLKIRLQRIGRKNEPAFRLVITESKNGPQSGKFLEILGSYTVKSDGVVLKRERISHWLKNGVQVSPTAHNMLVKEGLIEGRAKNVLSRKAPTVARKELKKK